MTRFSRTFSFAALTFLGFVFSFQSGRHIEKTSRQAEITAQMAQTESEITTLAERIATLEQEVERLSSKYEVLHAVIQCESSGQHKGNWGDVNYSHPAYGITQIQERTFYWLAGKANFQGAEWKNREHQLKLLSWGIDNGYGSLWTCYREYVTLKEGGESVS